MSSPICITDDDDSISPDDDSFSPVTFPEAKEEQVSEDITILSSDDEFDSEFPNVNLKTKKSAVIKKLFPSAAPRQPIYNVPPKEPSVENKTQVHVTTMPKPKNLGVEKHIAGLKVNLPLKPYPSQLALLFKVNIFVYK